MTGVVQWVATWLFFILLLVFLAKMPWGRPIVAGLIWLAVLLLLVSHSEEIAALVSPQALQLNG